ncbi:MAG: hypothetical protein KDD73_11690 [Anaerolineales bacterium]|nr:hypothetical protein [Anaerolineales bacterium]MCB9128865.1 hypothetical protein [Ardenticatenales bacterium]
MKLPDCPFFHHDAFRGREVMRCRLLERQGEHEQWSLKLCASCPVPSVVRESDCEALVVEGHVVRRFGLFPRMTVFAVCAARFQSLDDPRHCPHCATK